MIGSNANEKMSVSANGSRVRFSRDIGAITMDLDDVEGITAKPLGGTDTLAVNDLTGTDTVNVDADLAAFGGGDDAAADNVVVSATSDDDSATVTGAGPNAQVAGLSAQVSASGAIAGSDRLTVNGLDGDDVIDASGVSADSALLTLDGGAGSDVLIGGAGDDILLGGAGDDILIPGPGNDTVDGGTGSNIVLEEPGDSAVTSATAKGNEWLAAHARVVNGKTLLDVDGKKRTLPRADLSALRRN